MEEEARGRWGKAAAAGRLLHPGAPGVVCVSLTEQGAGAAGPARCNEGF